MAYNEFLADRLRKAYSERQIAFVEKKMMGGLCYLVNDKMCTGIVKEKLMVRLDPEKHAELLKREGVTDMDFTHRPMKGFIFVEPAGYDLDSDLDYFVNLALEFNPRAKSSKKK